MADGVVTVDLVCVQLVIGAERKMPVYDAGGRAIQYSSEATSAVATFVMDNCPVGVAVPFDELGNARISDLIKALHDLVGRGVALAADVKAINGVSLPKPAHVELKEEGL